MKLLTWYPFDTDPWGTTLLLPLTARQALRALDGIPDDHTVLTILDCDHAFVEISLVSPQELAERRTDTRRLPSRVGHRDDGLSVGQWREVLTYADPGRRIKLHLYGDEDAGELVLSADLDPRYHDTPPLLFWEAARQWTRIAEAYEDDHGHPA